MFHKSSMLFLIVAIQFSQIFAAPRDENFTNELEAPLTAPRTDDGILTDSPQNPFGASIDDALQSMKKVEDNFGDSLPASVLPMEDQFKRTADDSIQQATEKVESVANFEPQEKVENVENPEEHFSHMLTKEQELKILHQVPEFTEIIQAMERLPDGIYDELNNFLKSTVPRMPADNLFTQHFQNAKVLVDIFERLIKIAKNEGPVEPANKELFDRVHKAAPEMKAEMNQFNGFINNAKSRLAMLGTSTNPMNSMDQPSTAGINVTEGQVTLPVDPQPKSFADEFAPTEESIQ